MKAYLLILFFSSCRLAAAAVVDPAELSATAATDVSASAASDFQPADALYAPEEVSAGAQAAQVSSTAISYYSQATLVAADFVHDARSLEGIELFIDGKFVGKSPVTLNGYFVNTPRVTLSAHGTSYRDSVRQDLALPAQGEARIYMVGDDAVSWYTTPSFIAGLCALGASIFAYSEKSDTVGLSLVIGGAGVIALSQAVAHLIHLPGLQRKVMEKNSGAQALP